MGSADVDFCTDAELGYEHSATKFSTHEGLQFDPSYRLAHLPLVNPTHPLIIPQREGADYLMGQHAQIFSLVMPLPDIALRTSDAFGALETEMAQSCFGRKISWEIVERRRNKLHGTICGSLSKGAAPALCPTQGAGLAAIQPFGVEIRGLFSGNVNLGRLYLKTYPEKRDGRNVFQTIQNLMGRPTTDLYPVGLYNLTEELTVAEAAALADIIQRWREVPLLCARVDHLWLLGSSDDLVLESTIAQTRTLGERRHM